MRWADRESAARSAQDIRRSCGFATFSAEDFGFFAQRVPAFYFYLGITPPQSNLAQVAMNHTARFCLDESGLAIGACAATAAVDYLRAVRAGRAESARR